MPLFRRAILHSLPPEKLAELTSRLIDVSGELLVRNGLAGNRDDNIPGNVLPDEAFHGDLLHREPDEAPDAPDLLVILDADPQVDALVGQAVQAGDAVILVTDCSGMDALLGNLESGATLEQIRGALAEILPAVQKRAPSRGNRITESMALVHLEQDMTGPVEVLDGPEAEPLERWNGERPLFKNLLLWLFLVALLATGLFLFLRVF